MTKGFIYSHLRLPMLRAFRAHMLVTIQWGHYVQLSNGKRLWRPESKVKATDSFLANFFEYMIGGCLIPRLGSGGTAYYGNETIFNSGSVAVLKTTSGASNTDSPQSIDAAAASTASGILYSTDTSPVAVTDYALNGLIANGTGSGQLSYDAMQFSQNIQLQDGNPFVEWYRPVTNNSGATINVAKVYVMFNYSVIIFEELNSNSIINGATTGVRIQMTMPFP